MKLVGSPESTSFAIAAPALQPWRDGRRTRRLRRSSQFLSRVRGIDIDDIGAITPPPFLCWAEQPSVFAETTTTSEDLLQRRTLLILKCYLLSLKRQYDVGRNDGANPYLKDRCIFSYSGGNSTAHVVTEKVSLHPTTTSAYIWDEAHGIRCSANFRIEIVFNHGFETRQSGHAILANDRWVETYLIPAPRARIRGLCSGRLYPEFVGDLNIVSSNGFVFEIHFLSSFYWLPGQRNCFEGKVYKTGDVTRSPI